MSTIGRLRLPLLLFFSYSWESLCPPPAPPRPAWQDSRGTLRGQAALLCGRRFPAQVPCPDVEDRALRPPSDPATLSNGFPSSSRPRGPSPGRKPPRPQRRSGAAETGVLGPVPRPRPPPPRRPPRPGPRSQAARKDLTGSFLQLSRWGSSATQLPPVPCPHADSAASPPRSPLSRSVGTQRVQLRPAVLFGRPTLSWAACYFWEDRLGPGGHQGYQSPPGS